MVAPMMATSRVVGTHVRSASLVTGRTTPLVCDVNALQLSNNAWTHHQGALLASANVVFFMRILFDSSKPPSGLGLSATGH